jgi:hypothetical protein
MDALHIASEFLMDTGRADQDDVEDAEVEVAPQQAPAPQGTDDEDDYGDFSDEPHVDPEEWESLPDEPEEEEPPPPPAKKPVGPPPAPGVAVRKKAEPAPPPEPEEPEGDEDEVEPVTKQQAGAGNFLKPAWKPAKKSPVSKWFKK